MKLPDFTNDLNLNALRGAMGAALRQYAPPTSANNPLTDAEIEILAREGMEIPIEDVKVLPDGTLAFKDRRVVLYIRDVRHYRNVQISDANLSKFHVANCDKLREMRSNNRFERYVVATRDSGLFQINIMSASGKFEPHERALRVCQRCLGALNWENFVERRKIKAQRSEIVNEFSLAVYFERYGKTFIAEEPKHTDQTGPINDYDPLFGMIAKTIKQKRGYRCDQCGSSLAEYKKFLHAHHINGLKYDNREENIELLCIGKHAEQAYHSQVKSTPSYRDFLRIAPTQFRNCTAKAVSKLR